MRRADERKNDNVRIPVGFPKFQLAQGSFSREKIQQTMARFTEWFEGLNQMESYDDDLSRFEADGAALLPVTNDQGYVESDGARIWYATYGSGSPVILLHGGLGHGGNWGYQIPALVRSGYRAVLIDSRGHGRSTRDARPFMYEMMAFDVSAVMDALQLEKAALIGWSDGATIALILAMKAPARVAGVYFFACKMDPSGVKQIMEPNPILDRCLGRHAKDYAQLSATPDQFKAFVKAVSLMMRTQPNYSAHDLAQINVPVAIVHSEHDEFIRREHAENLARTIPNAELVNLLGVSHFAPVQRPAQFNVAMLAFLGKAFGEGRDVGRHDVLAEMASEVGLPQAGSLAFLESDTGKKREEPDYQR